VIVDVIDHVDGFDALRSEWDQAASANVDTNVFLTWEWLRTWWRHFGQSSSRTRLHLVVVRDTDGLVAAAPLFRARRGIGPLRATLLQQVSFDAGDYGGILLVRRDEAAVDALLSHLADQIEQAGVRIVVLSRLASDSAFLEQLRKRLPEHGRLAASEAAVADPICPYVDVRAGFDLRKRRKKNRVPQRMAKLRRDHDAAFEYHTGPTLETGIEALVDIHQRRWADRPGEPTGLLSDPATEAFLRDALRAMDARGWLRLLTLRANGRPIATRLDLEFGGRNYMLKHAIDPDFTAFSPGHLTHHRVFEDGIARGIDEFDFLRGDDEYKRRWTNRERHLVAVTLSRHGPAGRRARRRARLARRIDRGRAL
jgi:CelD/BcsL family acetyltransferase involved in cellulose biosynthesis